MEIVITLGSNLKQVRMMLLKTTPHNCIKLVGLKLRLPTYRPLSKLHNKILKMGFLIQSEIIKAHGWIMPINNEAHLEKPTKFWSERSNGSSSFSARSSSIFTLRSNRKMGRPQRKSGGGATGGDDQLHAAARNGDLSSVISILASNPSAVNSRDKHSRTPLDYRLHLAAWSGQAEVINYLCKNKADVGAAAMDDMAAIHFASQKGHLEVVRTLISCGGSVKASTRKGMTPLHYAVQGSYLELVKYLAKKGANLSARTKAGQTSLDLASNEEIRLFLEEYEKSSKKEELKDKGKAGKTHSQPTILGEDEAPSAKANETENEEDPGVEQSKKQSDEEDRGDEQSKRKSDGTIGEEALLKPKKAKVSLGHLLTSDDTQEDDENS